MPSSLSPAVIASLSTEAGQILARLGHAGPDELPQLKATFGQRLQHIADRLGPDLFKQVSVPVSLVPKPAASPTPAPAAPAPVPPEAPPSAAAPAKS